MRRTLIVLALVLLALPMLAARNAQVGSYRIYLPLVLKTESPPAPTPVPPQTVFVRGSTSYRESSSYYIVGEVVNNLGRSVYYVNITARYFDSSNRLVAVDDGYTLLDETRGDQPNPFRISLSNAPANIARYELSLNWQERSFLSYRRATVLNQQVRNNFGVEVFGEVRNDEARELRSVEVAVTFYDAAGNVVEVEYGFATPSTLAAGASGIYDATTFRRFQFDSYRAQAEGYLAP